jgi:hypothetical protein
VRQARQVEVQAANERRFIGFGRRSQAGRFQTGEDEGVERTLDPARVVNRRRVDDGQRLERPVIALPALCQRRIERQPGPFVDPAGHKRDLVGRQRRSFGRHF